jgi:type VI secretion system FHA domain protein
MDLNLTVIRYQDQAPQQVLEARIGPAGGTVGRAPDNDLVLPDPERWVSSHHARIDFRDGNFLLTDTSKNGTFLNRAEEPVGRDQQVQLHDGDELGIGAYEVRVALAPARAEPAKPFDPFARAEPDSEPPGGPLAGEEAPDILELVGGEPEAPGASLLGVPGEEAPGGADDWLKPEPAEEAQAVRIEDGGSAEPLAQPDHTPDERAFFTPPGAVPEDYDILADEWRREQPEAAEAPAEPGAPPAETESAVSAPREPAGEPPPPPEPVPAAAGTPTTAAPAAVAESDLLDAFLAGLGTGELPRDPAEQARLMQGAGLLLRSMTEGLMQCMMARSRFKSELRVEMTTIRSTRNNPFKFSGSPEDALDHLLFRPGRGFMPPREAATEAFGDVQRHEMAIVAGLRGALRALLARMEPKRLEEGFRHHSVVDNLLPMARKAKYWELFTETYEQIAADAADDFLHLFGEAFKGAYEEQVSRLKRTAGGVRPGDEE